MYIYIYIYALFVPQDEHAVGISEKSSQLLNRFKLQRFVRLANTAFVQKAERIEPRDAHLCTPDIDNKEDNTCRNVVPFPRDDANSRTIIPPPLALPSPTQR